MRILLILLLSGCAHNNINTNTYMTDNLKVSYKDSEYTRGLDVFKIGMKVARVWYKVKDCTGIDPGKYRMIIKLTDDVYTNYPGETAVTLSNPMFDFTYSEVGTSDLSRNLHDTRHETLHYFLASQGDPDSGHKSKYWDLCDH